MIRDNVISMSHSMYSSSPAALVASQWLKCPADMEKEKEIGVLSSVLNRSFASVNEVDVIRTARIRGRPIQHN